MDIDLAEPARDVLVLRRVAKRTGLARRVLRLLAALVMVASADAGDSDNRGPSVPADLVVERRDNGAEVLRLDTDMQDEELLAYVQGHLETLTVGDFCTQWNCLPGRGR